MVRLELLLLAVPRRSLQSRIMNKRDASSIAGPGRTMAVTTVRKRRYIGSIRIHRVNIFH